MIVHQLLSGAGPRDAVTSMALAYRAQFRAWGWEGSDYAARTAPGLNGSIAPLASLRAAPDAVLMIHHSAGTPNLAALLALPNPKLMLYHNVTPAEWLWDEAPLVAAHCEIGRAQLHELVRAVDVSAGVSQWSAAQLRALGARRTAVIAPLVNGSRLDAFALAPRLAPPRVMFVGRLSPHKRQDDVIRAFAMYRDRHARDARLVLVGDPVTPAYGARLRALASALAPNAVTIEQGLADHELGARYRAAGAFLCLSAHEGFCIPLLEAMHFGVPIIARRVGAVAEVVGDAGVLVDSDDDLAVAAELLHLVLSDAELREELGRRGRARLEAYAPPVVAEALREAIESAVEEHR